MQYLRFLTSQEHSFAIIYSGGTRTDVGKIYWPSVPGSSRFANHLIFSFFFGNNGEQSTKRASRLSVPSKSCSVCNVSVAVEILHERVSTMPRTARNSSHQIDCTISVPKMRADLRTRTQLHRRSRATLQKATTQ